MTTRIKLRRDTAANWTDANPILAAGEPGVETDTGLLKIGEGTLSWSELAYYTGSDINLDDYATKEYIDNAISAIPDQIRGTAGTISTDATYAGSTSNRFDFTIANTSTSTQTVYYGYTKI